MKLYASSHDYLIMIIYISYYDALMIYYTYFCRIFHLSFQGFRRIVYFLDRPDVLAVYSVRLEADRRRFPTLLSNGNCVSRGDLPDGRHFRYSLIESDPIP